MLGKQAPKREGPPERGLATHLFESPAQCVLGGLPDQNRRDQLPYLRDLHAISPPFGCVECSINFNHLAACIAPVSDRKHKTLRKSCEID